MKIGMLIPEFPTQTHIFFWREIEALRAQGAEVHILSTKRPSESCPHEFARRAVAETHYIYPPRPSAVAAELLHCKGIVQALGYIASLSGGLADKAKATGYMLCAMDLAHYARRHNLDHIHVHSCADAAHIVVMAHLLCGVPYSLHLHGDLAVYGKDHQQKMARASFVAVAARPMGQQVIELAKVPASNVPTLWMGVDTSRFQPTLRTSDRDEMHIVSIGRLHLCKGHGYTLMAIRQLLDEGISIRYTIAGSGPHRQEIEKSIKKYELSSHVALVGSLGELQVKELLASADAFVLSSVGLGEASPVAVMEAMAAGVPVITSIIGGTPEMIEDGIDGLLIRQEDVAGIMSAIRRLHYDVDFRQRIGAAARRRAVAQFDCRATSARLVDAIANSQNA